MISYYEELSDRRAPSDRGDSSDITTAITALASATVVFILMALHD